VRCFALLCSIVCLYLVAGSPIFPEWYYTLLWEGGYADSSWWQAGLDFWVTDHPFWFYVGITVAVGLLIVGFRRRATVLSFIDRFAFRLIAWSLVGAVIAGLVVRIYGAPCLPAGQLNAIVYELALKEFKSVSFNPTVQVPVDFHYIDTERVKSLYNEIEQELVEQQRTVGSTGAITGKIGGKAGPIEGEIGGSKQQNSSSTYQRLEFSPERKCVEVMNYVLKVKESKYLTTFDDWLRRRQAANFQTRYNDILRRALQAAPNAPSTPLGDTAKSPTKDEQEAAAQQLEGYKGELKSELASLNGLLFVEGDFAISATSPGTVTLVEKFSETPRIVFRITAPGAPGLSAIVPSRRAHFKIFGTVVRPLVGDAPIELRPIAVF
jgi:hypothetical protein